MLPKLSRGPGRVALIPVVAAVLALAPPARAEFLTNFVGNTQVKDAGGSLDGTLNFAVLDRTGAIAGKNDWGVVADTSKPVGNPARYDKLFDSRFVAGTNSAALDTSAKYLYLFQVVNNGTGTAQIKGLNFLLGSNISSLVTSFGYFGSPSRHEGFNDGGPVDFSNNFGQDNGSFAQNNTANVGVSKPSVVTLTDSSSVVPVTVAVNGSDLSITFNGGSQPGELAQGNRTVLIGFTSNVAPVLKNDSSASTDAFQLTNGSLIAAGHAPLPMPEPSGLALVAAGLGCAALFLRKRRGALAAAQAAA